MILLGKEWRQIAQRQYDERNITYKFITIQWAVSYAAVEMDEYHKLDKSSSP